MTLLIMAAGMGSRYGGLKQLDGLGPNDELIIEYSIYDAIKAGFDKVVFIIREEHKELFEEKVASRVRPYISVEIAFQEIENLQDKYTQLKNRTKPLGTGHAILCAKKAVGNDDFVVINADDFYSREAFEKAYSYLKNFENNCMVGYKLQNTVSQNGTVSRGVCDKDEDSFLANILEHEKINSNYKNDGQPNVQLKAETIVSMNVWGMKSSMFDVFDRCFENFLEANKADLSKCEFYITVPIKTAIDQKLAKFKVIDTDAKWFGVTYKEDRPVMVEALDKMTKENIYPKKLWQN